MAVVVGKTALWIVPTLSLYAFPLTSSVEVLKIDNVGYNWKSVSFENSYASAPVVVCSYNLPSGNDKDVVVRIKDLTTTSFKVKIQHPLDSSTLTPSSLYCMVAKEGVNTLENGYRFEAHKVLSTDTSGNGANGWDGTGEDVTSLLTLNHGNEPAVIGQVMSYNDPEFSTFWTYNCSTRQTPPTTSHICVGKHIGSVTEPSAYALRKAETLGVIIIESGSGTVNGISFLAALGADTIKGLQNGGGSYTVPSGYTYGVATLNAMDGGDGGWAVFLGSTPLGDTTLDLAIAEDRIKDNERWHTDEQVAYLLFSADPGLSWMEVKKINGVDGNWHTVTFNHNYTTPVPVCTYHIPAANNIEAVVRIRNLSSTSMQIRVQRPQDSSSVTTSDVYCVIMEEGTHTLGGKAVEAHRVVSDQTNQSVGNHWESIRMEQLTPQNSYTNPVVLGQVITYNDNRFSAFWTSNGTQLNPPTSSAIYVGKEIAQDNIYTTYRNDETVGFMIGAPHEGKSGGIFYALKRGSDTVEGVLNSPPPPYSYSFASYAHKHYSYGVVSQNAEDGGAGGWAVLYGNNPINTDLNLAIDEAIIAADRQHTTEQVSYWVFDPYPDLNLSKTSCVIKDPVNNTTHPKRIPGATIRYALEVKNTGKRDAKNVVVSDTLQSDFDTSTIQYLQVQSGECNCTGVSSANNNGANGGVSGSTVTLDYGTVAAGTPANPTYECGYFEVKIR